VDGTFYGSSGTSGFSGGYGGAARRWIATSSSTPLSTEFFGTSVAYGGNNFTTLDIIKINKTDADSQLMQYWLTGWTNGILKIEKRDDLTNFGIYYLNSSPSISGNIFTYTNFSVKAAYGNISNGSEYLISFVDTSSSGSTAGTSGTSGGGEALWSGSTTGNIWNLNSDYVGINEDNPIVLLHLQSREDAPVVMLNTSGYTTSPFIQFSGGTETNDNQNIYETDGTLLNIVGFVRIVINDTEYWMPYYQITP